MSASKQPAKVTLLPFQDQNVASNQQNVPVPWLGGTRVVSLKWITPALNEVTHQAKTNGKKG